MQTMEAKTLKALLAKSNWQEMRDVVEEDTFPTVAARKLYATMAKLHDDNPDDLSIADVRAELEATYHLKLTVRDELLEALSKVGAQEVGSIKDSITTFVQKSVCLKAANYVATRIDEPDFCPSVPVALFQKAADMSAALEADVMDTRTAAAPGMEDRRGVVSLGLHPDIDLALGGGIAIGELVLYQGFSNMGKTSHMCWSGHHAARLGCNVLHISCEDSQHKILSRYDSCLTGLDKDGLLAHPERVMEKRHSRPGNVYVQEWSSRKVRASDIRSLVMRLNKTGRPIDYVVLDYLGKMVPDEKMGEWARPYGQVADEVRRVANELQFRCLSGWQGTRITHDGRIQTANDTAEDIGVFRSVDGVVGISANKEQLRNKRVIHNVIKSRDGTFRPARIHHVDMDCMVFFEATTQDGEEADVEQHAG